jgi:hypothetical protein
MSKVSLKTQNVAPLALLMLSVLVIAYFVTIGTIDITMLSSLSSDAGLLGIFGVVCILLSHLIPAEWKHMLVFFRIQEVLPGHRFIKLSEKDSRIDSQALAECLELSCVDSNNPVKQNNLWYQKIYRPHRDRTEIASIHKSFLLYRDAATVCLFLLVIVSVTQLLLENFTSVIDVKGLVVIALFWVTFVLAAQNAGKRFVTTSVAVFLTESNGV